MSLKNDLAKTKATQKLSRGMNFFGNSAPVFPAIDKIELNSSKSIRKVLRKISPERCRPWSYHNRNRWWFTENRIQGLVDSIKDHGQIQPGLVRLIENDKDYDYEVIFGLRRCYACKLAGIEYTAEVTKENDAICSKLMLDENEYNEDISELEKCFFMADQIGTVFKNATELAKAFNLSKQIVGRRLAVARLKNYPNIMAILEPVIAGVSLAKAKELINYLESDNYTAQEIDKPADPALSGSANNYSLKESILDAKKKAPNIIKKIIQDQKNTIKESKIKNFKTYLTNSKGKPILQLADMNNGKIILSINVSEVHKTTKEKNAKKILYNIVNDLKKYFNF